MMAGQTDSRTILPIISRRIAPNAVIIIALLLLCACSSAPSVPNASRNSVALPISKLTAFEQHWRGVPYRYGGSNKHGIDCSAFVQQTYRQLTHIQLPRTTTEQAKLGKQIALTQVTSGDLLFFKTGWRTRHVGIYLSHSNFMHASTSDGVTISSLASPYWQNAFWQARRIIF